MAISTKPMPNNERRRRSQVRFDASKVSFEKEDAMAKKNIVKDRILQHIGMIAKEFLENHRSEREIPLKS